MEQHDGEIDAVQALELTGRQAVGEDQQSIGIMFSQPAAGGFHLLRGVDKKVISSPMSACLNPF